YAMAQSGSLYNYAPYFTATGSNFVSIPDSQELRLQQQFSVSAWFRTTMNNNSQVAIIVNKGGFQSDTPGTPQQNYGIWITGSNQGVRGKVEAGFEDANGRDYFVTSPNTYNDGQWHYAVVTYDGSTLRLYVDGQQVSSLNTNGAAPATDTMPLTIGKNSSTNSRYFIGDIDEVRIYNRALTAQEVNDAYNGTFTSNGLLIYLDMRHELLLSGVTNMEDLYYYDLLNEINNANRKISLLTYWLEYKNDASSNYRPNIILNAIKDAKNRGVDVRLMFYNDSIYLYPDLEPFLQNNGISYKLVFTHAKIINIDDRIVYIGSGNINNNGLRNNHEIFVKSYNANIINRAIKYFDNLWSNSGSRAFNDDGYDNILVSSGYFDSVLNAIQNARDYIRILMFHIRYNNDPNSNIGRLLYALNDAKYRNVDIKVIVDTDYASGSANAISYLKSHGIPVKSDEGEPPRTHIKMVIVDGTIYIGSHNWTENTDNVSDISIKLRSPFVVQDAIEYFDWKWVRGRIIS
ncbi:MAG: phospholipase D-like domain-containing protein, partial [Candidatus Nitrosocaldus sp.]